jgi:hypothetical protein
MTRPLNQHFIRTEDILLKKRCIVASNLGLSVPEHRTLTIYRPETQWELKAATDFGFKRSDSSNDSLSLPSVL